MSKKNHHQAKVREAFGDAQGIPSPGGSTPRPLTAEQLGLRRLGAAVVQRDVVTLNFDPLSAADRAHRSWLASSLEALEKECVAGTMPAARQETIVWLAVSRPFTHLAHALGIPIAEGFVNLAVRLLLAPDAGVSWNTHVLRMQTKDDEASQREALVRAPFVDGFGDPSQSTQWVGTPGRLLSTHLFSAFSVSDERGLRARLAQRGPVSPACWGKDPVRAIFMATRAEASPTDHVSQGRCFFGALSFFGLEQSIPAADTRKTPFLSLAIEALGNCATAGEATLWLLALARAPHTPWLSHESKQPWTGLHPLWALARRCAAPPLNSCDPQALCAAIEGIVALGHGVHGETPGRPEGESRSNASAVEEQFQRANPTALWAFLSPVRGFSSLPAVVHTLIRLGVDIHRPAPCPLAPAKPVLRRLNEICSRLPPHQRNAADTFAIEVTFKILVAAGLDPLDALPAPSIDDIAEGALREIVGARLEKKAMIESIAEVDLREALDLLAAKRAAEAKERSAIGPLSGEPTQADWPASRARRSPRL